MKRKQSLHFLFFQRPITILLRIIHHRHSLGIMSFLQHRDEVAEDLSQVPNLAMAHGITMGLAFLVIFPIGAVLIRGLNIKQTMWMHASCQIIGLLLMLVGFATGMRLGNILDEVC
jgi:hypothetical protein